MRHEDVPRVRDALGATGYDKVVERIQAAERLNLMACVAQALRETMPRLIRGWSDVTSKNLPWRDFSIVFIPGKGRYKQQNKLIFYKRFLPCPPWE
jgi:hypothetical protein